MAVTVKQPAPGLPIEQQPNNVLRRILICAEARGEPAHGQLAVLCVAENRAKGWQKPLSAIILQPKQFSSFNADDPNRVKLLTFWKDDPAAWAAADAVASIREQGLTLDPTHGSLYYYNPAVAQPKWGRGNPNWMELGQIGNHCFGNIRNTGA